MKICLLNVLHEAYDKRVFQKVGRSLADAGHEVASICPWPAEGGPGTLPEHARGIRFRFIAPAPSKRARLLSVWRLARLGRAERADLYLAPEPESWVAALLIKASLLGRTKVAFDMHEHAPTEFAKFFPGFAQGAAAWLTGRFMRIFARWTDHVLLTRESFAPLWAGLRTPRTVVINTNHLQAPCTEIPKALRARYAGRPVLIHQGQFGDVRGSYQLLEAVRILAPSFPDLKCIVLGDYVFGSLDAYVGAIRAAGLEAHFDILPPVPYEEVPAYIACAQAGLILFQPGPLNHTLAMPHKLFDYLRECRPVVAPSFAVEVARIMNETECGALVDVTSPAAIAEAAAQLLGDPERARRLGENGRRLVETKYHWAHDEARLLEAVRSLEG